MTCCAVLMITISTKKFEMNTRKLEWFELVPIYPCLHIKFDFIIVKFCSGCLFLKLRNNMNENKNNIV
jgi:hypothetical protein